MARPLRVGNCSGFFGDRLAAAREMVEGGPLDVLTGDWLAELTLWILARTRERHPGGGYARTFVTQMEEVLGTCLERGIRVVSNAGGLDPEGCARAVAEVARRLGLRSRIAFVQGDDLSDRLPALAAEGSLRRFESGEPIDDVSSVVTANAYLGGWGIAEALALGADVVITGRVTDAALVSGPAAWHHGWGRTDWDALAGAVVVGHILECGTQATGGNYSFFQEVSGMTRPGFPWAEIAEDGSSRIGKHDGTGGEVSIGTVTSQLLYEIGGPCYAGPDVVARWDTIRLEAEGPDRVRVFGVQGEPPPETLKVCLNRTGGYRNDMSVGLTGLDIEAKARLLEEAFWRACPHAPGDYARVVTRLLRTDRPDPPTNEQAVALWRITVKDPDPEKVGRAFSDAMIELALASIPGFFTVGGRPGAGRPFGVYEPARVPARLVSQRVTFLDGATTEVSSEVEPVPGRILPAPEPTARAPEGPTVRAPLGAAFGTRSGDKGGDANLGVFARSDEAWAWLDGFLDEERLRRLLPEVAPHRIERFRLPALRSLNFVIHDLLEEGVAAATRQDSQAKGLGEWLRARVVELPATLLR